jgi:hypothetical protein
VIDDSYGKDIHAVRDMLWLLLKFKLYQTNAPEGSDRNASNLLLVTRAAMESVDRRYNKLVNARLNKRSMNEKV